MQDGTRDGATIRAWMHQTFLAELEAWRRPYRLLKGSFAERLGQTASHVDEVLATANSEPLAMPR